MTGVYHWAGIIWVAGLTGLQSIPGTGALRTLFFVAGVLHLAVIAKRCSRLQWPESHGAAVWLASLTGWLIIQSSLLALDPANSLKALGGEWMKLLLMSGAGILLAAAVGCRNDGKAGWSTTGLFMGFFLHVVSTVAYQSWMFVRSGSPVLGESFLGNYGYVSPFVTGAFAFLLAEVVVRSLGRSWLRFSNRALAVMLVATLAAQAMLVAKASLLVSSLLVVVAAGASLSGGGSRQRAAAIVVVGILAVTASLAVSNRWSGGLAELAAATVMPPSEFHSLGAGARPHAGGSFYDRAVWARIGLDGIGRHPLGLGYGADAFGRYVVELGGPEGAVSSHSGWIDFALANGVPGLLLLLGLFWAMMSRSWLSFREGNPAGLAALLVILNFVGRSVLDGNLAGSRLTGFAFVAAAVWALAAKAPSHRDRGTD